MSLVPDTSESTNQGGVSSQTRSFVSSYLHLPRNVYLLLLFTTGKGFQLSISTLTLDYYVHSLGYHPDFIGVFSAMPAIGALVRDGTDKRANGGHRAENSDEVWMVAQAMHIVIQSQSADAKLKAFTGGEKEEKIDISWQMQVG